LPTLPVGFSFQGTPGALAAIASCLSAGVVGGAGAGVRVGGGGAVYPLLRLVLY
jgi:hypothetical protein